MVNYNIKIVDVEDIIIAQILKTPPMDSIVYNNDTDLYQLYNTNIHEKIAEEKKHTGISDE